MIKLTYIFHSGFALETDNVILVFDYCWDPAGVMDSLLHSRKPLYVFVSHYHEDHFSSSIFYWKQIKKDITYILSKDILQHHKAMKEQGNEWLAKGDYFEDNFISVAATGSNDSGVSWIVRTSGKTIFHAGDLNNWFARFLSEINPGETIYSWEMGEDIDPVYEESLFLRELNDIKSIENKFDVVMFPVDGRIGNGYTRGARQFISLFQVGLFVPMHFVASGFKSAWRMKEFTDEDNIPFWSIQQEGESLFID